MGTEGGREGGISRPRWSPCTARPHLSGAHVGGPGGGGEWRQGSGVVGSLRWKPHWKGARGGGSSQHPTRISESGASPGGGGVAEPKTGVSKGKCKAVSRFAHLRRVPKGSGNIPNLEGGGGPTHHPQQKQMTEMRSPYLMNCLRLFRKTFDLHVKILRNGALKLQYLMHPPNKKYFPTPAYKGGWGGGTETKTHTAIAHCST